MNRVTTIHTKLPVFRSYADEKFLFAWLDSIRGMCSYKGVGRGLDIVFVPEYMDEETLRDLVALFVRYELDIQALNDLEFDQFPWFREECSYWSEHFASSDQAG